MVYHEICLAADCAALDERAKKIADGLAASERGKLDLEWWWKSTDSLREGKEKANEIIAQAEKRSLQMIEEAKAAARVEADRIMVGAKAEIEQEAVRTKENLRDELAKLAVLGGRYLAPRD